MSTKTLLLGAVLACVCMVTMRTVFELGSLAAIWDAFGRGLSSSLFIDWAEPVYVSLFRRLTVDEVLLGYDMLYERRRLFDRQRWKGMILEQDPNDAFAIQDYLWTERPDVMIEIGTNTGGAAVFFADIMTAYNPDAHVITIDIENRTARSWTGDVPEVLASSSPLWGGAIRHIVGWANDPAVRRQVEDLLTEFGARSVFINEDSSHRYQDVYENVLAFHDLVEPCGWILIQDTKLARIYPHRMGVFSHKDSGGGSIRSQRRLVEEFPEYRVSRRWEYLMYTQHAQGWLQKVPLNKRCERNGSDSLLSSHTQDL